MPIRRSVSVLLGLCLAAAGLYAQTGLIPRFDLESSDLVLRVRPSRAHILIRPGGSSPSLVPRADPLKPGLIP
jgi:hypothetical protein